MTLIEIGTDIRKARVTHECECGRDIRPGERYERKVTKVATATIEVTCVSESHIHSFEQEEAARDAYWDGVYEERI